LSYILRHHPERFNIKLDAKGYANLEVIIKIINSRFPNHQIGKKSIKDIIELSNKRRFEIIDDRIRAFYGHSIKNKIEMQKVESVPDKLYHGTNLKAYQKIKKEGLKRKSRQYVHLSKSIDTAYSVGKRRTNKPIILMIQANQAGKDRINFYKSGDMYLADYIPPDYISLYKDNP
jgi:putative RNA 2'-phosphotransferase